MTSIAQADSVQREKPKHSPRTATLLALVPSAGQAYNRKYWKMPIVYATIGGCVYLAINQQQAFNRYKNAYLQREEGLSDEFYGRLSKEALLNNMDSKRTTRDYALAGALLFYALQIVDANVDAHLFYFDVGDNLTARLTPQTFTNYNYMPAIGLSCTINFK